VESRTLLRSDVKLLRWPAESARRARYKAMGVLRLLVVEGGAPAPICTDIREDWVRAPITDADLRARVATLQADAYRLPQVDPYGILRFAERSISVSPSETDLLECLIRQFGTVVPRDTLHDCLPDRPGGVSRNALDLHIMRLRRRIRPLGLVIRTARGRGYLLESIDCSQVVDQRRARPRAQLGEAGLNDQDSPIAKVTPLRRPHSRHGMAAS
jgi:DNA-binding winged helix-turn-helix (wHTH) protein